MGVLFVRDGELQKKCIKASSSNMCADPVLCSECKAEPYVKLSITGPFKPSPIAMTYGYWP